MPRIAIAGFQHETNLKGIGNADPAAFEMADSWPGLLSGQAVIDETRGMNLPIAGFVQAAARHADLVPILWCAAEPSGPVTDEAFNSIAGRIVDGIARQPALDGVYLDLHGAMVTESHDDGEAAILRMIRNRMGPRVPIAVSLDMHANVSEAMASLADVTCIFRTYPHLDMAETGARCWDRLRPILSGRSPAKAFRTVSFRIPLPAQQTNTGPARRLYKDLPDTASAHVEMALGFTAGTPDLSTPSIIAYAEGQAEADRLADAAFDRLLRVRDAFDLRLSSPREAVQRAMAASGDRPVLLADVQDNPGAGASSDTVGLLRALVAAKAQGVLLGLMHDPDLSARAHRAGVGARLSGTMGGSCGLPEEEPYEGEFLVEAVSDGRVRYTGEMYGGGIATLGKACVVRLSGIEAEIRVVVCSIRNQCLDLAQFTAFGLEPHKAKILVVKSTAHFRADFEPMASEVHLVAAPGLFPCVLDD